MLLLRSFGELLTHVSLRGLQLMASGMLAAAVASASAAAMWFRAKRPWASGARFSFFKAFPKATRRAPTGVRLF